MSNILLALETKYKLPPNLKTSVKLLVQGIPTLALTQFLQNKTRTALKLSKDGMPTSKEIATSVLKTLTLTVQSAFELIWKKRYDECNIYQQTILNIQTRQKKDPLNERRPPDIRT